MGLINKNSGEIFINGKELDINDISLKKEIGYLPSEINLYDDFTVKEMLDYHVSFYDKKVKKGLLTETSNADCEDLTEKPNLKNLTENEVKEEKKD